MRLAAASVCLLAALGVVSSASARPKGSVAGRFTNSALADPSLAKYMTSSNVFCVWSKGHVLVHVNLRNSSAAHLTATIEPRYDIARGGQHGSGITNTKNYGFDAGGFRSLWIDAGAPSGITANTPISQCAPDLFLIKTG